MYAMSFLYVRVSTAVSRIIASRSMYRLSWLRGLAEWCRRRHLLLIVDDVQTGCGRRSAGAEEWRIQLRHCAGKAR